MHHIVWIGSKKYSNDTLGQHRNLSWGKTSFKLLGINFDVDLDKIVNINYQRLSRACIVHLVIKKTNWSYVKTMSCVILELRST